MKAVIIGSGIAGIASAIRLAVKGYEVTVLEANPYLGGKMSEFEQQGFRFDAGPSLFTLPNLVDELFTLTGKKPEAYFFYQKLDIITQYFWPDGTRLTAYANEERFFAELEEKLNIPATAAKAFFDQSARLYSATADTFLNKSLHRLDTYLSKDIWKTLIAVRDLGLMQTMHEANSKRFHDQPKFVQLLDRFATYNGSNPYAAPATLNIIPHLEHGIGAFYPSGGIYAIVQSLTALAQELGVNFETGERVVEIITSQNKVQGVKTANTEYSAQVVVSNADINPTYHQLLPIHKAPEKTLQQPKSSSALIFYWGINRQFAELDLHNIFFSEDYEQEFKAIFEQKTITSDPTVYVNITSKYTPTDAPAGCENWFVMINVPANEGQDWDLLIAETRARVVEKLSRILKVNLQGCIVTESILDPRSIEARTSSHKGALYGASSNNRMAAFLRHPNFNSSVKGLYFCGGSVHPGGGIPLCLLSAKIVSELVPVNSKVQAGQYLN